jgi:hypothetical protein
MSSVDFACDDTRATATTQKDRATKNHIRVELSSMVVVSDVTKRAEWNLLYQFSFAGHRDFVWQVTVEDETTTTCTSF